MAKVKFLMKETTYGEYEVELPDNYTEEDLENARSEAYNNTPWIGKMEVTMISEEIQDNIPHYKNGVPIGSEALHEDNWLDEINKLQKPKSTSSFYPKFSSCEDDMFLEEKDPEDTQDNRDGYY